MKNERKFVIDVNVLISAFLFQKSTPRLALDLAQNIGIVLMSNVVLIELEEVLFRSKFDKYLSVSRREELINDLIETVEFIDPNEQINDCRDPKNNKYLELAFSGKAESVITGDEDLLVLNPFR